MQLIQIKASHFMRYHHVDISLPSEGLFCIQGANESGKSTIGHLIYFAFSGLGPKGEAAEHLINWESNQMKVQLSFEHRGDQYQLFRQVDRDGSNFSKLTKGGDLVAQGNSAIASVFQRELGFQAPDLMRSFLITHNIIQKLVNESNSSHVDYMLRLDHLNDLGLQGRREVEELEKNLLKTLDLEKRNKEDQSAIGYSAIEDRNEQVRLSEFESKFQHLQLESENVNTDVQCIRTMQETIEKTGRGLPSKVDFDNIESLERPITSSLTAFSNLRVREGKKGILDKSIAALQAILDYSRDRSAFLLTYENHLEQLRKRIGMVEDDDSKGNSLSARELSLSHEIALAKKTTLRLSFVGAFVMFLTLLMVATVVLRSYLWRPQPDTFVWHFLHEGAGNELRIFFVNMLDDSGPFGCSRHTLPWAIFAFLLVLDLLAMLLIMHFAKKIKNLRMEFERVSAEKKSCIYSYHGLLAADIKDMSDLSTSVETYGSQDLKETFFTFKNRHTLMSDKAFDVAVMIHQVREHCDGIVSHLKLERHQLENRNNALHQQLLQVEESVHKSKNHLKEWAQKKALVDRLQVELEILTTQISALKKDRAIKAFMSKLAEGTLITVKDRLRRALTLVFKDIMPKITQDRYAAIRLRQNFEIEVFSDERGDFVSLSQLSSGTNDLFILIFQMVLVQGFMDSREINEHFLFLDEPLLTVDSTRYQKLMAFFPNLCTGLKQIFLCHPPLLGTNAYVIYTQLDNRNLIVNFADHPAPNQYFSP